MAISYKKLWKMLIDKDLSKTELTRIAGLSTNAMAKLGRNEDVRVTTLEKLCTTLDCKLDDIVEFIPDQQQSERGDGGVAFQGRNRLEEGSCGVLAGGYGYVRVSTGCDL